MEHVLDCLGRTRLKQTMDFLMGPVATGFHAITHAHAAGSDRLETQCYSGAWGVEKRQQMLVAGV
jgi:hypothetical protein